MQNNDFSQFSPKWQFRFNFFEKFGLNGPEYKQAYKQLGMGDRLKVGINFWAFFFNWIFFLVMGMWRKALSLIVMYAVLVVILSFLPAGAVRVVGIMWSALVASIANYAYYLHKVKGSTSWNPFEGFRWK